ncbi:MAG: porin, partial [Rhodovibrionaceae bacterium]|nr:porin [Rhodovibrionaceae bacterium]
SHICVNCFFGPGANDENTNWHQAWSVGANYNASFEGFDIGLSAGYNEAQAPENGLAGKDQQQYTFGGNLGFAGFTVGGSYAEEVSSLRMDGHAWEAGAQYNTGPVTVSVNYLSTEHKGTVLGDGQDEETQALSGAVGYALGPGIDVSATVMWAEHEDDSDNASGPGSDQDGVALILGTSFVF